MMRWAGVWLGKEEIGLGTHLWGCGLNYLDIQGWMRMNYDCVFESRGVGLVGWGWRDRKLGWRSLAQHDIEGIHLEFGISFSV